MFKTQYIRRGKNRYALPATVQKAYFTIFDLEPEPMTSEYLEHIAHGLEKFFANDTSRDMEFEVSKGVIRDIRGYIPLANSRQAYERYLPSDDEREEPLSAEEAPEESSIVDVLEG